MDSSLDISFPSLDISYSFSAFQYACFLLVVFLLEAVSGILAYMYEASVHDELVRGLNRTMLNSYLQDDVKTEAIDKMHQEVNQIKTVICKIKLY